jgi:hypothetical protein
MRALIFGEDKLILIHELSVIMNKIIVTKTVMNVKTIMLAMFMALCRIPRVMAEIRYVGVGGTSGY